MSWRSMDNTVGSASGIFHEAGSGLMRMTGGWGNFPGPGIFMLRTIIAGTTSAITMGLAGSGIAATIFGTATLPFLVFACAGFIFGAVGWYRNTLQRSLIALKRNPRLMRLHLDANYPDHGFHQIPQPQLMLNASNSWTLQSMLVCSWLTAQPALDHMIESQEQAITANPGAPTSAGEPPEEVQSSA